MGTDSDTRLDCGHTPGPWFADLHNERRDGGRFYVFVTAAGLVPICAVTSGVEGYGRDEGRANANLIGAAPELLEALEKIAEATSAEDDAGENYRWDDREGALDYAFATARAAIAKARGQSPLPLDPSLSNKNVGG